MWSRGWSRGLDAVRREDLGPQGSDVLPLCLKLMRRRVEVQKLLVETVDGRAELRFQRRLGRGGGWGWGWGCGRGCGCGVSHGCRHSATVLSPERSALMALGAGTVASSSNPACLQRGLANHRGTS